MERKNLREYALIALVITLMFFLIGLVFGGFIQLNYADDTSEKLSEIRMEFRDVELAFLLQNMNSSIACDYYRNKLEEVNEKIKSIKPTIIKLERDLKVDTDKYRKLKRRFMAARLEYWMLLEAVDQKCPTNKTTILYFYKTKEKCRSCTKQGHVLSYIEKKHDEIEVVPVDRDEDLILIDTLQESYNISKVPALLLDRNKVMRGFTSKEKIYDYICKTKGNNRTYC